MIMVHNKLYTKGYFLKRLKDKNISYNVLDEKEEGNKKWSLMCFPDSYKIVITCHKNTSEDFYFKIESSKLKYIVKTLSMDIIFKEINNLITQQTNE